MAGTTANLGAVSIQTTPRLGGNHVATTHLAQMWKTKIDQVFLGDVVHKAFSAKRYIKATPLLSALNGLGKNTDFAALKTKKVEINGFKWTWYLESYDETCVHIVENIESGNPFPGFGTNAGGDAPTFSVKFDKPWPRASEVYAPRNKNYQIWIKAYHGGNDVNGHTYEVQLLQASYCPVEYLQPNERWVKLGPGIETEAAQLGGGIQFPNKFKFENVLTTFRQTFSMTGDAMLAQIVDDQKRDDSMMVMKYDYMDKGKAKTNAFWIHQGEMRFWSTWFRHIEVALWYGQKITNTIRNEKGHNLIGGAGVRELLKDSNQFYTNDWTASLYEDFLDNIQFDRISPGGDREIHGYAGSRAISKLHQALKAEKIKMVVSTEIETRKVKSMYHKNAYAYGLQYTEYHMTNGAVLKLMHNPIYDDRRINTQEHPTEKGKPAESYKITFFDLDPESDMNSNIQLVEQKGYKGFWVVDGATNGSFGPGANKSVAHLGSWSSCATGARLGVWIKDLTACGEIQLALNF